jgi:RNA polymerase sigma factor (sigma-70 family)
MGAKQASAVLRVIRKIGERHRDERTSDRDLLRRFAARRDEEAFTALVRRHGAMVLGVGLRVLRHYQDAEDVCQATFLLLAKKASATAWRASVANWLYEVAYHLALKAREAARRRKAREVKAQPRTPPDPLAEITVRDLQGVLDEELSRLAPKYRTPLLLCCLEGKTRDEAARCLGVPLSTVIGRLETGRERLRRRLARRGVPLALAFAGGTLLVPTARAAVAPALAGATTRAAVQVVSGKALTQVVSPKVASLVKGGMHAMLLTKLKLAAAGGLVFAVACLAAWAVLPTAGAREPPKPPLVAPRSQPPAEKPAPAAVKPAGPGTLLLARERGLITLTPEGKQGEELSPPDGTRTSFQGQLSPDGTRAAQLVVANGPLRPPARQGEVPEDWPFRVVVHKLGTTDPIAVVDFPAQELSLAWAQGGKGVLVTRVTGAWADRSFETFLLDPATGKTEPLALPAGVRVLDCAQGGKTLLVVQRQGQKYRLGLVSRGDAGVRDLTELQRLDGAVVGRLSPNGKRVVYTDADPADKYANKWGMSSKPYVLDLASKKRQPLAEFPLNGQCLGVAWSPDGKRVAYTWKQLHEDLLQKDSIRADQINIPVESFLMIADADGKNARTVASARGPDALRPAYGSVDWR